MSSLDHPDDTSGRRTETSLRSDFEKFREEESRRRVTRVILAILLLLLVLFIRLMPLDWASGSIGNLLNVSNFFGPQGPGNQIALPTPTSEGAGSQGDGASNDTIGGTNFVVGSPGPSGAPGPRGPAGKDGSITQLGFGQGQAGIGACDPAVTVRMRSVWSPKVISGGAFTLALIRISDISAQCNGLHLMVDLLGADGLSLLSNPLEISNMDVGVNGEVAFTNSEYPELNKVLSSQLDKLVLEAAA